MLQIYLIKLVKSLSYALVRVLASIPGELLGNYVLLIYESPDQVCLGTHEYVLARTSYYGAFLSGHWLACRPSSSTLSGERRNSKHIPELIL